MTDLNKRELQLRHLIYEQKMKIADVVTVDRLLQQKEQESSPHRSTSLLVLRPQGTLQKVQRFIGLFLASLLMIWSLEYKRVLE